MSRIDDALKRAVGHGRERVIEVPDRQAHEARLEDYPREAGVPHREFEPPLHAPHDAPPFDGPDERVPADFPRCVRENDKLVVAGAGREPVSLEQYRRIAASLHELQLEKGLKTIVVTSSVPREGKTLTAVNLALTFSESYGRRVLLIDADLRRPSVHEILGVPNEKGLSELLRADDQEVTAVHMSQLLDVLPAGRPEQDPLAGLSSDRIRVLLDRAAARYDWVIMDTPPLALLSDAALLGRLTQAAVFVVRAGSTPFPVVSHVLDGLGREFVVGLVLNGVDEGAIDSADYHDYYYGSTP